MPRRRATPWANPTPGMLVWIVTGVLLLCAVGMGVVSSLAGPCPSELQRDLAGSLKIGFQMSLGALLGLLGSRTSGGDLPAPARPERPSPDKGP
jgi:hypothetical protein